MELDEFKDVWNHSADQPLNINQNITDMIYNDSKGPLAILEKKLKFTLWIFPVVLVLFGGGFLSYRESRNSPATWLLFIALVSEFVIMLLNQLTLKKMEWAGGGVKHNLLNKLRLIETRFKWNNILYYCCFGTMPFVIEFGMYLHLEANFTGWLKFNPLIRIAVYAFFFLPLFYIRRESQKMTYGQYVGRLSDLVKQME